MSIEAESADGVVHEFPDGTDRAVIDKAMYQYAQTAQPSQTQKAVGSPAGGFAKGLLYNTVAGTADMLLHPRDPMTQLLNPIGAVSSLIPQSGIGKAYEKAISPATGAMKGAEDYYQKARQATGHTGTDWPQIAGDVASVAIPMPGGEAAMVAKAPSALRAAAKTAYELVDRSGMLISPQAISDMAKGLEKKLADRAFHPQLEPRANVALREVQNTAEQGTPATLQHMEVLRRIAGKAADTLDKGDKATSRIIQDHVNDFVQNLDKSQVIGNVDQPALDALGNARKLWSQAAKGDQIQSLIEKAKNRAPQLTASGMENALRTEFRKLAQNDRGMARFSPAEQKSIQDVARGGPISNTLRFLAGFSPKFKWNAAAGSGVGFMLGGPLGAAAVPLAGESARLVSTMMTKNAAKRASELVRGGKPAQRATPGVNPLSFFAPEQQQ